MVMKWEKNCGNQRNCEKKLEKRLEKEIEKKRFFFNKSLRWVKNYENKNAQINNFDNIKKGSNFSKIDDSYEVKVSEKLRQSKSQCKETERVQIFINRDCVS